MSNILSWYKMETVQGTIYPISREGHSLTFIDDLGVLMFGGFGASLLNEFYIYEIENNKWKVFKTKGRQISPRCYHTKFYHHPYLFIYAGQGEKGRSLGDFYAVNMTDPQLKWKKILVEPPYPRHQHTLVGFREGHPRHNSNERFLFGGINMPENILFNDVWIMNFSNMSWIGNQEDVEGCTFKEVECTGDIPSRRKGHSSLCYNNSMYVFGGQTQDINEKTTDFIHMLDLTSYNWTQHDVSLSKISPRCQMSLTWLSPSSILFFGGLENQSNEGLNDIMCLDLEYLHFSFPFTAGEYPEARYGHASCNYTLISGGSESLMLLGGINQGFSTMDIYTLVEIQRSESQTWEKIIQKDVYENKVTHEARKFVYQSRKHCLDLNDIILKEKSKGIEIRKNDETVRSEYKVVQKECEVKIKKKDKEIEEVNLENKGLEEEMEKLVKLIKHEFHHCQVLEEKGLEIEDYFRKMQDYMNIGDKTFTTIRQKYKNNSKKDRMRSTLQQYKKNVKDGRKSYQEGLLFLKHFYEKSIAVRTDYEGKVRELKVVLEEDIPDIMKLMVDESYQKFMKEEEKNPPEEDEKDLEDHVELYRIGKKLKNSKAEKV